jgi:hypothetical protein
LPHAPYSPDLSPCDFFYSDNLNEQWKAIAMLTFKPFKTAMTEQLRSIPETAFRSCFNDLQKCWQRCSDVGGTISNGKTAIMCIMHTVLNCQSRNFTGIGHILS